jgi:hypothetical protein
MAQPAAAGGGGLMHRDATCRPDGLLTFEHPSHPHFNREIADRQTFFSGLSACSGAKKGGGAGERSPFSRDGPNASNWASKASESSTQSPKLVKRNGSTGARFSLAAMYGQQVSDGISQGQS